MFNSDNLTEGMKLIEQGIQKLATGPLDYNLKKLLKARELLLTRFVPFKVGDRVTLTRELNIKPDSGWYHSKHFLVPGSLAKVRDSDCDSEGYLRFSVEFDNESWIDREGIEHPVEKKSLYTFFEDELKLI